MPAMPYSPGYHTGYIAAGAMAAVQSGSGGFRAGNRRRFPITQCREKSYSHQRDTEFETKPSGADSRADLLKWDKIDNILKLSATLGGKVVSKMTVYDEILSNNGTKGLQADLKKKVSNIILGEEKKKFASDL